MRPPRQPPRPIDRVRRRWWYLVPPLLLLLAVVIALGLIYLIGAR